MPRYKNFLSLTKTRKTTYEFDQKNISKTNILNILEAARWAPSCGNAQPWYFIVVEDKKTIKQLVGTTHYIHAPFIHPLPPVVIAFVLPSDKHMHQYFEEEYTHCCIHSQCTQHQNEEELCFAMSVFSSTLAATDLGISSCILTPQQDQATKLLKVEKIGVVRLLVGLGYEKNNAFQKARTRRALKDLVFYDGRRK
ncbi:MAG: nitroreductase family protein [Nanoarchaeota archaeon]|nr:nitroreductase family protein [Nanoarchaeota archaeon]